MKLNFKSIEEIEKAYFSEGDEKVIRRMIEEIERADKDDRLIDWIEFKKECCDKISIPLSVIYRCCDEARKRANYKDNLNRKI